MGPKALDPVEKLEFLSDWASRGHVRSHGHGSICSKALGGLGWFGVGEIGKS